MLKRLRLVLIVLALAGTIFNAWTAVERASAVPTTISSIGTGWTTVTEVNWNYDQAIRGVWDQAAKREFWLLVVAGCAWILLPLVAKPHAGESRI